MSPIIIQKIVEKIKFKFSFDQVLFLLKTFLKKLYTNLFDIIMWGVLYEINLYITSSKGETMSSTSTKITFFPKPQ